MALPRVLFSMKVVYHAGGAEKSGQNFSSVDGQPRGPEIGSIKNSGGQGLNRRKAGQEEAAFPPGPPVGEEFIGHRWKRPVGFFPKHLPPGYRGEAFTAIPSQDEPFAGPGPLKGPIAQGSPSPPRNRGQDMDGTTPRAQHPARFRQQSGKVLHMFQRIGAENHVEGGIREGDAATIEFVHWVIFAAQAVMRGGGQIKGNDPVPARRQQRGLVPVVPPQLQNRSLLPQKPATCLQLRFSQPLQGGMYPAIPKSHEGLLSGVTSRPATAEIVVRQMWPSPGELCHSHFPLGAVRPSLLGRACRI